MFKFVLQKSLLVNLVIILLEPPKSLNSPDKRRQLQQHVPLSEPLLFVIAVHVTICEPKADEILEYGLKVEKYELRSRYFSETSNFGFGIQEHIDLGTIYDRVCWFSDRKAERGYLELH